MTNVLAIPGSLRAASINAALLRACARLAPDGMHVQVYAGLGSLPLFNPDLEASPPREVQALRAAVAAADVLLLASPEYAHGVSGAMKNALDWLVSFEPFYGKPVAVPNASPRAQHAHAALCETLRTMSASIIRDACIALPLLGAGLDEQGMVDSPAVSAGIRALLVALRDGVQATGVAPYTPLP
jgi:NAD(P)H-dependent FMN reductase